MEIKESDFLKLHRIFVKMNPSSSFWSKWAWQEFRKALELQHPKLSRVYEYLKPRFQKINTYIRDNKGLLFKCSVCNGPAVGTSHLNCVCSKKCVYEAALSNIKDHGLSWRIISLGKTDNRNNNQVYNRIHLECTCCGAKKIQNLSWLHSHYGCVCKKKDKIKKSLHAKFTHEHYVSLLKERGIRAELLSNFRDSGKLHVRCLECDTETTVNRSNLKSNSFCKPCGKKKFFKTIEANHGPNWRQVLHDAHKKAMVAKHGVAHALQSKEIYNKMLETSYKSKPYTIGSRVLHMQGYEPQAAEWLLKTRKFCKMSQLIHSSEEYCPTVTYTLNGKPRVYYPDFFVPHLNLIIEVKSVYTYSSNLKINRIKRDACLAQGFDFKFLIVKPTSKGKHLEVISPTEALRQWNLKQRQRQQHQK